MKKVNVSIALIAIGFGLSLSFNSCKEKGDDITPITDTIISGEITVDKTLTNDATWYIRGDVKVKAGATLTIEPGTTVIAQSDVVSYILIEQGAKIMAEGTATEPITFTSDVKESGSWGGIHICGKAPINVSGGTGSSEIGDAVYGGTIADDNSGSIKYCRIEYSGIALDEEHEANGLTLYGVGSATEIDYIQIYIGADDGIEFFGGTVNITHAYVYGAEDDCFDWTQGWVGKGQYWLAVQIDGKGDRGIEADNSSSNNLATPYSNPTLSQITLMGSGTEESRGVKLREGTKAQIYNIIVTGFSERSIDVEHNQTITNLNDGTLELDYAYISEDVTGDVFKYSKSKVPSTTDENGDGVVDSLDQISDSNGPSASTDKKFETSTNVSVGSDIEDYTLTGGKNATTIDSFFATDSNIGSGNAWINGWTK